MRGIESRVLDESLWAVLRGARFAPITSSLHSKSLQNGKDISLALSAPTRSGDARPKPNRRPSGKAEKVSMERGNGEVMPLLCCVILPRGANEPAPASLPRSVGRLPCPIDAVWFDSEKLLGKGGRKEGRAEGSTDGSGFLLQGDCNDSREGGGRRERRKGRERTRSWKGQQEES